MNVGIRDQSPLVELDGGVLFVRFVTNGTREGVFRALQKACPIALVELLSLHFSEDTAYSLPLLVTAGLSVSPSTKAMSGSVRMRRLEMSLRSWLLPSQIGGIRTAWHTMPADTPSPPDGARS
jgi:hypothetical protein